jgi:lipopolysaccharide transport system permease protein
MTTLITSKHRDLLYAWTSRIVRARYQQSLLGGLWAVFQPAATVAILTLVFSYVVKIDTGDIPYVVFSYSAMVPWILFSSSITDMVESITSNMNLVAKIYFPREILVLAALLARVLDFLIAMILLVILMLIYKIPISLTWFFLPLVLLVQFSLMLGIGLASAAINVFFRDVKHLITLGLQLWFYATPIIYPIDLVPSALRPILALNPMTGVITGYRSLLIYGKPPGTELIFSAFASILVLAIGYWFFKRVEPKFADII